MNCCIVLPVDTSVQLETAVVCAGQYRKIFKDRDIVLMSPDSHPYKPALEAALRPERTALMSVGATGDSLARGLDRLNSSFYDGFAGYDYVFVGSFRTWPVYDALDWWMGQGYDYVAAPWLGLSPAANRSVLWLEKPRGGRGECSLRRVPACRDFAKAALCTWNFVKYPVYEDVALSGGLPEHIRSRLPRLKYCPRAEQARFAWDRPVFSYADDRRGTLLTTLFDVTRGVLPAFVFDPPAAVYDSLLRQQTADPTSIVLVSSACSKDWDYSAVDGVAPPAGRMAVLFNTCRPYADNESVRRLVAGSDRVMTFHNDTVEPPYDYAGLAGSSLMFMATGFAKRHDTRTLRWRPVSSAVSSVVTYDGEIVDSAGTNVLRGVKSGDSGGAAPTAGYMGYRILRHMYPKTKIVLVNFFGNSHGFKVCERHNTDWEQEEYRKDPLVESMTVDRPAKKQEKETK